MRIIPTILFLLLFGCSQGQKILEQDFSFLLTDGEVTKLHQSNDTLFELKCYIHQPCQPNAEKHYKIHSSIKSGVFVILKLEQLDSIPLTTNPYPVTRYSVLAIKAINNKQLGYLPLVVGLTKQQLDTVRANAQSLQDKFFFTLFSDTYLIELSELKKVSTKDNAMEIIETMKSSKFKALIEMYSNSKPMDMYTAGLSAEILNLACIEKGYNPIGAGRAIKGLMRQ